MASVADELTETRDPAHDQLLGVGPAQGGDARYPRVMRAILDSPWAIIPSKLATIMDVIQFRADGNRLTDVEIRERVGEADAPEPFLAFADADGKVERVPYEAAARSGRPGSGAVAVLPLFGTIFSRASLFSDFSGGTTAQGFQQMFGQAVNDPEVGSILIEVDSPGGTVEMIPETAAMIRSARGSKPIVAIANTLAGSAAYYLAAQADEIVATPSSMLGSIGVIGFHTDTSERDAKAGIKTTAIFAGKYKSEGWPFEPLSDEAKAARQGIVNQLYDQFVNDVAKGRGVKASVVREDFGEGRVMTAKDAVTSGMADRVDTFDATVARLARGGATARPASAAAAEADELELAEVKPLPLVAGAASLLARPSYRQLVDPSNERNAP